MDIETCYLSEVYSAIQGEGPLVGVRQLFVRFGGCDLRCIWCDTPDSLVRQEFCRIEKSSGLRDFQNIKNPVKLIDLISYLTDLKPQEHHSISLTGGEPLLHSKFLKSFLYDAKKIFSTLIYLETGGHRPNELAEIINFVDFVSMDFKLPSSAKAGLLWEKHKEFLKISLESKKKVWVKIVITRDTLFDELLYSINIVKSSPSYINNNVEIILQPVTKVNGSEPPSSKDLLQLQAKLLEHYPCIRVLPQVHRLMDQI